MDSVKQLLNSPKMVSLTNWLLLLLGIWLLIQFAWSFWPQAEIKISNSSVQSSKPQATFDLNKLLAVDLFGNAQVQDDSPKQIAAPVTRLKLKLRGVYASEDEFASAIVEHNRKQEVYRIGSKLPGATGLKLYQIHSDRIILSRSGKYETLLIEDFDGKTTGRSANAPLRVTSELTKDSGSRNVIDKRGDLRVTEQMAELKEKLSDPQALAEFVTISPVMDEGAFKGFKVSPGKNRALFGRIGLRRNDIVTAVNGIDLSDPTSAFNLLEQMSSADEINLSIKRGNRMMDIKFSAVMQ